MQICESSLHLHHFTFTAFPHINVSNSQQIMCVKIHLLIVVAHFHSWQKIKMNRRISKQAYGNLNWVFLSHWYNLFNYLHYYIYLSLSKKQTTTFQELQNRALRKITCKKRHDRISCVYKMQNTEISWHPKSSKLSLYVPNPAQPQT